MNLIREHTARFFSKHVCNTFGVKYTGWQLCTIWWVETNQNFKLRGELKMTMKPLSGVILAVGLLLGSLGYAQMGQNVSGHRHPNLAAAQRLCEQAFEKISAAQSANEFDMDGHAAKAKDLLEQANRELKQAAEAANHNHK
jgi:hypothetical protein